MTRKFLHGRLARLGAALGLLAAIGLGVAMTADGAPKISKIQFRMERSGGIVAAGCLPKARANVTVTSQGPVEVMRVQVAGLPPNKEFDFFVTQVPNPPFGLSWYQGDIETRSNGTGTGVFVGRFNQETFIVAPGTAAAPTPHDADVDTNPATGPVHTFHLGLWFGSPADAVAAGCPGASTPFNGDHTAGVQVLSTRGFGDTAGPLGRLKP